MVQEVSASGSTLMELPGVGLIVAARVLADVGDVTRFAGRNRSRPEPEPRRSRHRPRRPCGIGCPRWGIGG